MKIYHVFGTYMKSWRIIPLGSFSTKKRAEEYRSKINSWHYNDVRIEEAELDYEL